MGGYFATECSICGVICRHSSARKTVWEYCDEEFCRPYDYCGFCGMEFDYDNSCYYEELHDWNGGVCTRCKNVCTHAEKVWHGTSTECVSCCKYCGKSESNSQEHVWEYGYCENCGYECLHDSTTTYIGNPQYFEYDGKFHHESWIDCNVCGNNITGGTDDCYDADTNGYCDVCSQEVCNTHQDTSGDGLCDSCGRVIPSY